MAYTAAFPTELAYTFIVPLESDRELARLQKDV